MSTHELPRHEKPGWRPIQNIANLRIVQRVEPPVYPADLDAATAYVLGEGLPEIACYDGSPGVQTSVAHEIASQIFVYGADINEALWQWSNAELRQQVAVVDITDTAEYTYS